MTSQSRSGQGLRNLPIGYNSSNGDLHEIVDNENSDIRKWISLMYGIVIIID